MGTNLAVRSNLMLDDEHHSTQHRYIPGDFLNEVYPDLTDTRVYERELSKQQIVEMLQYVKCIRCHRPCAGTCEGD